MDFDISPLVLTAVIFPIVAIAWLLTRSIRATHRSSYERVVWWLCATCIVGAFVGFGLRAPNTLVNALICFGFAFAIVDGLARWRRWWRDER